MNFKEFMQEGIYNAAELEKICSDSELSKHFFTKETMRFFQSRLSGLMWMDCYSCFFITSELLNERHRNWTRTNQKGERRFTVRVCDMRTGEIDTLSKIYEFETLHQARKFIYDFLNRGIN